MDRRKFCLSSVAAAISGAAAGQTALLARAASAPAESLPPVTAPAVPLDRFLYDRRFPAARAFGAAAERIRSTDGTFAIEGDVTQLWSRDLRLRWSTGGGRGGGGGAIAGMTTARTLFCLEELAKDHWMRVVFRADHAMTGAHEIAHRLTGPQSMMARITPLLSAGDWPMKIPAVLASCSISQGADRMGTVKCVLGLPYGRRGGAAAENLVSFVIA